MTQMCCTDPATWQYANVGNMRRVQPVSVTPYLQVKRWSVSNGLPNTDQVHSSTEGRHLGSLAAWRALKLNWPIIWPAFLFHFQYAGAELLQHLRSRRAIRRSRHASLKGEGPGKITDAVSIRERPASAEDRAVPGHWEGDLIFVTHNSRIATLVERHTRYVMLARVNDKDTETVINALIRQAHKLARALCKSLTWDRGSEMADHKRFTLATDIKVYFSDPQRPWQCGSSENTHGLLRQYFPKGTDLSVHSQAKLNAVARQLNERPRKTPGFQTPAERFNACVASIG